MKVLMLNPPFVQKFSRTSRSPGVSKGGCVYYPIWLAYATGALEQKNHEVLLLDASGENLSVKETMAKIKNFAPELVVVDTVTPSFDNDIKIVEKIKKEINTFVVLVGDHVSVMPEKSLKASKADAVAIREYEYSINEIANALKKGKSLSEVTGIVYKKEKKIIKSINLY